MGERGIVLANGGEKAVHAHAHDREGDAMLLIVRVRVHDRS